ncbi:MAG TPA: prolipoprotein diacylglyceryl transferase family protein [Polyangiaceae bacterium]|nr:prolipoprotein diacylglyceryl transferase family protein [Polyangiaceae bacterium]
MIDPLIPYLDPQPFHIFGPGQIGPIGVGELSIKPFGTLVALGVYVGTELVKRQGERYKLDSKTLASFVFYILAGGFIGGHVLDSIFYHPDHVMKSPLSLLRIWDGQSSFGGFTGAFIGLLYWRFKFKAPTLAYADVVASCFPLSWVFGRSGCSIAHDHPGMLSNAWLAVQYPGGGRIDLGLCEMVLTVPLAITFLFLMRKPRPPGFFLGIMCIAYAPTRFALDFLRVQEKDYGQADPRYGGLTPAQWGCLVLLGVGIAVALRAARAAEKDREWLKAAAPRFAPPAPEPSPSA